jgi:hypothetical protein
MFPTSSGGFSFTVALEDEQATSRLMLDIAAALVPAMTNKREQPGFRFVPSRRRS